jgi:hypothetical protein
LGSNASVELLNLNVEKGKNIAILSIYLSIWSIFKVPLPSLPEKVCIYFPPDCGKRNNILTK